jgi:hypothetical protein
VLAGEIARDLPDFTVHDITHLDPLWEMADLIAGDQISFNPAEAFVFGGAVAIHDLGLGLAAYPHGTKDFQSDPKWQDILVTTVRRVLQRDPSPDDLENADEATTKLAVGHYLRQLHAIRSEELAKVEWRDEQGRLFHLFESPELRLMYGRIIGRIAHVLCCEWRKSFPIYPKNLVDCPRGCGGNRFLRKLLQTPYRPTHHSSRAGRKSHPSDGIRLGAIS